MIGIFDSGIGGITVLKEIVKELPCYHYIYYSDSKNNPYGDKSLEELNKITHDIVCMFVNRGCQLVVIACNTASAMCSKYLRETFDIPIIAIEPAYKMVHDFKYSLDTLVMATKGTIESEKFLNLYHKFDNHKTNLLPCVGLADLIESGNELELKKYLETTLKPYIGVKNVVLGCTHYPLIKDEIKEILGDVNFFDGSIGVTKMVKNLSSSIKKEDFKIEFIDSSNSQIKEKRFWNILEKEFPRIN